MPVDHYFILIVVEIFYCIGNLTTSFINNFMKQFFILYFGLFIQVIKIRFLQSEIVERNFVLMHFLGIRLLQFWLVTKIMKF